MDQAKRDCLREIIREAINKYSIEVGSDTPDFMLAEYLMCCLETFEQAIHSRDAWYGRGMLSQGTDTNETISASASAPCDHACVHVAYARETRCTKCGCVIMTDAQQRMAGDVTP